MDFYGEIWRFYYLFIFSGIMWFIIYFLFFLLNRTQEDNVIEVYQSTYEAVVQQRGSDQFFLFEFYSPHCGICKNFMPTYSQLGDYLRGIMKVGRLSIEKEGHKPLMEKYKVRGVPFIILFKPGIEEPVEYNVIPRTPENIIKWIISQTDNAIKLTSLKEYFPRPLLIQIQVPNQFIILYEGNIIPQEYNNGIISKWKEDDMFLHCSVNEESMPHLSDFNIHSYPSILFWNPSKIGLISVNGTTLEQIETIFQNPEFHIQKSSTLLDHVVLRSIKFFLLYCLLSIIGAISIYYLMNKPKSGDKPLTEVKTSKFN